jgi:hypothetical protein
MLQYDQTNVSENPRNTLSFLCFYFWQKKKYNLDVQGRAHAKYIAIKVNSGKTIFIQFSYFNCYIIQVPIKYFFFIL